MPFVAPKVNTVKMDLASAVLPLAAIVTLEANLAANCVKAVAGRACKPDSLVISTVNSFMITSFYLDRRCLSIRSNRYIVSISSISIQVYYILFAM